MKIDINDEVDVTLRATGLKLWADYWRGTKAVPLNWNVGETRKMSLWEVAAIFGPGMVMGADPPIETEMVLHRTASAMSH